ncbi:MAG: transcriptional regulator MntR [Sulfobacillus thermosulfidooxidans]|uniref:Manganese transport regulator n=1 Tax=Sulfobacillus thermotolerans TaxID=338644 RepID=A0ABN5H2H6_9FIRM|nr:transcriptional regulator MntR [Sulfobacillus sp. hq2]AUW94801.1 manganese transport transcriptional regulator [Sulfobacillus thermotolerans]MCY0906830.1 transcriptional regulator MntR [Sulfobacillus thermotolerans]POB09809.1 manganese transport transcriptional regulator [Sulfobacillus sp. hq2]PSR36938.1 MAG: transcriptional regulator MntR [Sulfobacillus thermosulfidooxidans]
MSTPNQEDYLEAIWRLTQEKGYARVSDIAERLHISQASVSKMIRKLKEDGWLDVERYRGLALTEKGMAEGRQLLARHQILERFLLHLDIRENDVVEHDVEGIEHYFSTETLERLTALVAFIDNNPEWWNKFLQKTPPAPKA